jgi:prepilin-type N-terminal cleavage/methylation domain-containing protein
MKKRLDWQRGFTLIEAIVALAVLLIGALATCSAFVIGSRFNAHSEDRTIAANIAQLKMEEIKNTYYLSIVTEHPPGETLFQNESQGEPYWTLNSAGEWRTSLPEGKYEISYPGLDLNAGIIPDPLIVIVTVSWSNDVHESSSLSLKTIFSMSPGRIVVG